MAEGPSRALPGELQDIAQSLNSAPLVCLLSGIYTSALALMIYANYKRPEKKRSFIAAIVVIQYILVMVSIGHGVYTLSLAFTSNSLQDLEELYFYPPIVDVVIPAITLYLAMVIADGLMIWRCWNVWNRSFLIVTILSSATAAEAGLFFYDTYLQIVLAPLPPTPEARALAAHEHMIVQAGYFLGAGVTLSASTLIVIRIYMMSRLQSARKFKRIIEVVVESALLYTVPSLAYVLLQATRTFSIEQSMFDAISVTMTGLAPLLLVMRIHLGLARPDTAWTVSTSITHPNLAESRPVEEGKADADAPDAQTNSDREITEANPHTADNRRKDVDLEAATI